MDAANVQIVERYKTLDRGGGGGGCQSNSEAEKYYFFTYFPVKVNQIIVLLLL